MRRLGSVQQKIQCVFVTEVKEETSRKREGQVSPAADTAAFGLTHHKFTQIISLFTPMMIIVLVFLHIS